MLTKASLFFKIKNAVKIVLFLAKEEVLYIKEAKQQEEKIERLKAEAGDEYVIKKQVRRINYLKQHLLLRNRQPFRAAFETRVLDIHSKSPHRAEWIGTLLTICIQCI
uniref:Tubulin-specific chaperone A n=1 Tax=Sinocyclocheilus rhinocerous TaxID=307959 RepID=A0A673HHN2_9TELE